MAGDKSKVLVGSNGDVFVADTGATPPTDSTTPLGAEWTALGLIAGSGVTITPGQTINGVDAWQSPVDVRKIVASRTFELGFTMREFNAETIPFAMGGGLLDESAPGEFVYTPPDPEELDIRSVCVDWRDGQKNYRLYIPAAQVTDLGQFTLSRTAPAELPVTLSVTGDGVTDTFVIFSNDESLASGS